MTANDLHQREALRRKALWALAYQAPGNPRTAPILEVLEGLDHDDSSPPTRELQELVRPESRSDGRKIVRDESIPQPWRQRFLCASRGSTRFVEGAYFDDWEKFLREWDAEMAHLERCRVARRTS